MSVRIRLQRVGKKNSPIYRIVAIEKTQPVKGKPIEIIGVFDPVKDKISIDFDKYNKWIKFGAKPSDTVERLCKKLMRNKKVTEEIVAAISTTISQSNDSNSK